MCVCMCVCLIYKRICIYTYLFKLRSIIAHLYIDMRATNYIHTRAPLYRDACTSIYWRVTIYNYIDVRAYLYRRARHYI